MQAFTAQNQIASIDEKIQTLRRERRRITANVARHQTESAEEQTRRLRRGLAKQGKREARFILTGSRPKRDGDPRYMLFEYVYRRWHRSKSGFRGVALTIQEMARALQCTPQYVRRLLRVLEKKNLVFVFGQGGRGKPNRYAVSLPETQTYKETLWEAYAIYVAQRLAEETQAEANGETLWENDEAA